MPGGVKYEVQDERGRILLPTFERVPNRMLNHRVLERPSPTHYVERRSTCCRTSRLKDQLWRWLKSSQTQEMYLLLPEKDSLSEIEDALHLTRPNSCTATNRWLLASPSQFDWVTHLVDWTRCISRLTFFNPQAPCIGNEVLPQH